MIYRLTHPPDAVRSLLAMARLSSIFVALGSLTFFPAAVSAQELRGEVVDRNGIPVATAYVGLFDSDRELVVGVTADDVGRFHLRAPQSGRFFVLISRVGYRTLYEGPYDLGSAEPLEVVGVMHPFPMAIEGLTVEAEGRIVRLASEGFYRRRVSGLGDFLDREDMREYGGRYVSDVLKKVPGVVLASVGGVASGASSPAVLLRDRGGDQCTPTFYLDGMVVHTGESTFAPDRVVILEDLDGVEIYSSAITAPLEYPARSQCGVILFWTRR